MVMQTILEEKDEDLFEDAFAAAAKRPSMAVKLTKSFLGDGKTSGNRNQDFKIEQESQSGKGSTDDQRGSSSDECHLDEQDLKLKK